MFYKYYDKYKSGRYGWSRPARSDKWRWLVDPYNKTWPKQAHSGGLNY